MKALTLAILQVSAISTLLLATSVQAVENTSARLAQQEAEAAARLSAQQEAEAKAAEPDRLSRQNNRTANVTSIDYDSLAINDDIVLTDTQQQAVEYLTDASVKIINFGQIIETQSGAKFSFQNQSQEICLNNFISSEGYRQYQHDRAIKYVVAKTPQQIQQDIKLLTPQLVSAFHSLIANSNSEVLNDPTILLSVNDFLYSSNYQDLREYVNFKLDFNRNDVAKYFLWSMAQCDVIRDDLNTSK